MHLSEKTGAFLGPFFQKKSKNVPLGTHTETIIVPNLVEYHGFSNTKSQKKTLRTSKVMKCQKYATGTPCRLRGKTGVSFKLSKRFFFDKDSKTGS